MCGGGSAILGPFRGPEAVYTEVDMTSYALVSPVCPPCQLWGCQCVRIKHAAHTHTQSGSTGAQSRAVLH